jgi:hypothetical protein
MGAEMRKLPAIPAILDSADRHSRIGRREAVDEHAAGIEITSDLASRIYVLGPYIAAETELACIRRVDGSVDVRDAGDRGNGTESLFVEGGHTLSHSAEYRGCVEGSFAFCRFASAQDPCALCNAAFHLLMQRVPEIDPCHGSHLACWIRRVAYPDRLCCFHKLFFEVICYLFDQDEPFCRKADLTRIAEAARDARRNGLGYVRIFTDDKSIGAAQLHDGFLDHFSRL